jgi:multiple sugar transport system permease protein
MMIRHVQTIYSRGKNFLGLRETFLPYAMVSSLVVSIGIIFLFPLYKGIALSFFKDDAFIGLTNYATLFNDEAFWHALLLTLIYVIAYTAGVFFVGFVTALLIWNTEESSLPGRGIISSLIMLPYAIPDVVAALLWTWMFDFTLGITNYPLELIGLHPVKWLIDPSLALYSVLLATIWRLFPLHAMIILAGFRSIPREIYEAAQIDGAGGIRKFFRITLPLSSNVLGLLLLLTVVWSFKRFTMLWLMTAGGPGRASETVAVKIYREAFRYFNKNYAATIGTVMLIVVAILAILYISYRNKHKEGVM